MVESTALGVQPWEELKESLVWQAFLNELDQRDQYIMELLREGKDTQWSDDNMRGRLNELDYVRAIPKLVIDSIEAVEKAKKRRVERDREDNHKTMTEGD